MPVNATGEAYIATHPPHLFTNVTEVAFFFDKNHGGVDDTVLQYLGLQARFPAFALIINRASTRTTNASR